MSAFQLIAVIMIAAWLLLVAVFFRRSTAVLVGGLVILAAFSLVGVAAGWVTWTELGLGKPSSWLLTILFSLVWLVIMLSYSSIADRVASRWYEAPPQLDKFTAVQQSRVNLLVGIVAAWLLGGILEELAARGIVLNALRVGLAGFMPDLLAVALAVVISACGAGLMHLYQGPRAVVIITQLSILFGVLFVVTSFNLWAVILCHGLYDTIAFIRFATGKSRYAPKT
jgi:CAAX protease family protein